MGGGGRGDLETVPRAAQLVPPPALLAIRAAHGPVIARWSRCQEEPPTEVHVFICLYCHPTRHNPTLPTLVPARQPSQAACSRQCKGSSRLGLGLAALRVHQHSLGVPPDTLSCSHGFSCPFSPVHSSSSSTWQPRSRRAALATSPQSGCVVLARVMSSSAPSSRMGFARAGLRDVRLRISTQACFCGRGQRGEA